MLKAQKLTLAVVINAVLITSAYASEQSDAKGFVEGAQGSVLLRNGFIQRDKKKGLKDTNSWVQSAVLNLESGFTQGPIGFAAGVVGDFSFKLGDNYHSGNSMVALKNNGARDATNSDTHDNIHTATTKDTHNDATSARTVAHADTISDTHDDTPSYARDGTNTSTITTTSPTTFTTDTTTTNTTTTYTNPIP